jgi:membrane fusion protein, heavy metal efflux system
MYFLAKFNIACLVVAMLFVACKDKPVAVVETKSEKTCLNESMAKMITIDTARLTNIADELKLSGQVNFDENKVVKVFPFASGQVLEVKVAVGDRVVKGQTLAVIRSADVAGNYADLSGSKTDISMAEHALQHAETLFKNGLGSERDVVEARENFEKAKNASNKIYDQIAINGGGRTTANGTYVVAAPRNGLVLEKKVNPGAFIRSDNTDNLFTVGDFTDVWIWANVYESDISKVKEGYVAKVTTLAYPDKVFLGKIDKINDILDPQAKVMKVRVSLQNPDHILKPEMFTNVLVENRQGKKAVSISTKALISENGRSYVVVYKDKCDMHIQEVSILKTIGDQVFIASGLNVDDKLIAQNQILLFRQLSDK